MEQSGQSSHSTWIAHWTKRSYGQSTHKLETAMVNVSNQTEEIKNIEKPTFKVTETSKTWKSKQTVINIESRIKFDIFNTSATGLLCFDSTHSNSSDEDLENDLHSSFFETSRMYTTVDSVKDSRFSRTKKTDSNLFKSDQTRRNPRRRCLTLIPPFKHVQHGVKTRSLRCFSDSKPRKMDVVDDSELSAETEIMDLGDYKKTLDNGEEERARRHKMNLKAHISSMNEQTFDYEDPITSRTQTLDKETVLSHVDHRVNSPLQSVHGSFNPEHRVNTPFELVHGSLNPEHRVNTPFELVNGSLNPEYRVNTPFESVNGSLNHDLGGRWLKRLKLNESTSCSTGSDCMEKPHLNRGNNSKNHGKELMMIDDAMSTHTDSTAKMDIDVLLSNSWIKRWCHHHEQNTNKSPNEGEKHSTNLLLLKDKKMKKFPSIAAMALMAKTMNCLESYDIYDKAHLWFGEPKASNI